MGTEAVRGVLKPYDLKILDVFEVRFNEFKRIELTNILRLIKYINRVVLINSHLFLSLKADLINHYY